MAPAFAVPALRNAGHPLWAVCRDVSCLVTIVTRPGFHPFAFAFTFALAFSFVFTVRTPPLEFLLDGCFLSVSELVHLIVMAATTSWVVTIVRDQVFEAWDSPVHSNLLA